VLRRRVAGRFDSRALCSRSAKRSTAAPDSRAPSNSKPSEYQRWLHQTSIFNGSIISWRDSSNQTTSLHFHFIHTVHSDALGQIQLTVQLNLREILIRMTPIFAPGKPAMPIGLYTFSALPSACNASKVLSNFLAIPN
jgi:hypothetical protein